MNKQVIFLLVCLPAFGYHAIAQDGAADSVLLNRSITTLRAQYMKNIGENSYLYNGVAFERYWNRVTGHPFFMEESFKQGSLYYNGSFYEDVPLMYDINNDAVVSKNFSKNIHIQLLSEKIRAFTIGTHSFVRIDADSASTLSSGFYEKLYEGAYTVLAKHGKKILLSKAEENSARFIEFNYYYIAREDTYQMIRSESDLLPLFKDQRSEIRKFLNRKEISFKKDPVNTIVQTVKYYEQLKK